jgi:hypothetical protein
MPMTQVDLTQIELADVALHVVDRRNEIDQTVHFEQFTAEAARPSGKIAVTASGLWGGRPFDVSGIFGSLRELADVTKPYPIAMKAVLPGLVTTVDGTIDPGLKGESTANLAVTTDSADMGATGHLFGMQLPSLGAARASFTVSGPLASPHVTVLDLVFGRRDALAFSVKGNVADPVFLKGVDVAVTVDGESLPVFGRAFDLALPAIGPIHLTTHLNDTETGWRFTDIKGGSQQNDLTGHLVLSHLGGRSAFDAAFESTRIEIGDHAEQAADASGEHLPDGRIFSDRPLPFALLGLADGSLNWTIRHLSIAGLDAADVKVPATLHAGRLDASVTVGQVAGGRLNASLSLDIAPASPQLTVSLNTDKVEAGPILAAVGFATGLKGAPSDLHVTLSTNGDNPHAMTTKLAGEGTLTVGEGSFNGDESLPDAPWLKGERIGLTCGFGHFSVEDGLAVTDAVVLDLTPVTIGGRGSINLGREELDLILVPRLKDQASAPELDVGGTLRHPSVLAARGTTVKGVAPALLPSAGGGGAGNVCLAAVMAKRAAPVHHLVRPPPSTSGEPMP